jgi:peroxiredoxin
VAYNRGMNAFNWRVAILSAVLGLAVFVTVQTLRAPRRTLIKAGEAAPDFTLPVLGSPGSMKLSRLRGLPLLLVFFDTTSSSAEPQLFQIQGLYRDLLPQGFRVLGVAVDEDPKAADRFLAAHKVTFPVLSDPGGKRVREVFGTKEFPEAYLLEPTGHVAVTFPGLVPWNSSEVRAKISPLLPFRYKIK